MLPDLQLEDILRLRKPHPCGGVEWKVVRLGADIGIVTELIWWREARWFQDMGVPLLVVDHTVSEEPGMINLARYLSRQFPDVKVEYQPTHCPFRLIRAGDGRKQATS